MVDALHDLHLVFHLLIQNTILDKPPFLEFLGGIRKPVILGRDFVHHGKGSLADGASLVVLSRSGPVSLGGFSSFGWGSIPGLSCFVRFGSLELCLGRWLEQVHMTSGAGSDGLVLTRKRVTREEVMHFLNVGLVILVVSVRNSYSESKVSSLLMDEDANDSTRGEHPFNRGRIGPAFSIGVGGQ